MFNFNILIPPPGSFLLPVIANPNLGSKNPNIVYVDI